MRAVLGGFIAALRVVPYALVALILRLVMARAIFLAGQAMVSGPDVPLSLGGFAYSIILPAQVRPEVLDAFATKFAAVPLSSSFIAHGFITHDFITHDFITHDFITHGFAYAEFLLPLCLIVGFATRVAAFLLLAMTVVLQVYVDPGALWTLHAYWFSLLLVLTTLGGGAISLDRLIRQLYLHA
jgi:putative oxidoreductase